MSLWLRPHVKVICGFWFAIFGWKDLSLTEVLFLQCYPKFGDAVFTLTKFFRERGMSSPAEPKLMERLSTG